MKIFVIPNNYELYNKSCGDTLYNTEKPMVYTKADSALLKDRKPFFVPDWSQEVDAEAQLAVRVCRLGMSVPPSFAYRFYDAVSVGVSFTTRDILRQLVAAGQPWELATGFDGSAAIGEWVSVDKFRDVQGLHFRLDINAATVLEGRTSDMLHHIDELVAYVSRFYTLKTGDILYTGAPVAPVSVHIDDHLEGYVEDRKVLEFNCK